MSFSLDIASFVVGSNKSLTSRSRFLVGEIYSARWKLMLISDQAKVLVKNCFEGRFSVCPFQPLVDIRDLE